jgi:Glu-tRNA(Gln) amidotransferase subunit E-like FAD-binding protein
VAVTLVQRVKALRRAGQPVDSLTDEEVFAVFEAHAKGLLSREGVLAVLEFVMQHPPVTGGSGPARVAAVFAEHNFTPLTDADLDEAIAHRLTKLGNRHFATPVQKARFLCGQLLRDFIGRIDGAKVVQRVNVRLQVSANVTAGLRATRR